MSDERPGTRGQEHTIEIDASPADVWRAISDAEEVTRWYVADAEIDDHVGGTYRVSWGEGMDGTSDITVFDAERHLQVQHRPMEGQAVLSTGPMVEEYFIESRDDRTVLRLVTSGIPDTQDWDWFYEGTKRGWRIFLLTLRHYLEHHPGTPRDHIVSMIGLPGSFEEAWSTLMGAEGFRLESQLAGAAEGDEFATTTAFGQALTGELKLLDPPHRLLATAEELNNALLGITIEQMGAMNSLYVSLSTFGLEAGAVNETRGRWEDWLHALFPGTTPPVGALEEMIEMASKPEEETDA